MVLLVQVDECLDNDALEVGVDLALLLVEQIGHIGYEQGRLRLCRSLGLVVKHWHKNGQEGGILS